MADDFDDLLDLVLDLQEQVSNQKAKIQILERDARFDMILHNGRLTKLRQEMKLKSNAWYIIGGLLSGLMLTHLLINWNQLDILWHGILVLVILGGFIIGNVFLYIRENKDK